MAGELGHRRAGALFAVLAQCRLPVVVIEGDPAQSRMDVGVRAGPHREADVAVAGVPQEIVATGRVGAHLHGLPDQAGVVTDAVAECDLCGQLHDGGVEDGDVIGDAVRPRIAGALPADTGPTEGAYLHGTAAVLGDPVEALDEGSTDSNIPMNMGIAALTIDGGGRGSGAHALDEAFDSTNSWQGTQRALLIALALAQP